MMSYPQSTDCQYVCECVVHVFMYGCMYIYWFMGFMNDIIPHPTHSWVYALKSVNPTQWDESTNSVNWLNKSRTTQRNTTQMCRL